MTTQDLLEALTLLADCDHFDQARRAAALLPEDLPLAPLQRASDGAQQVARALSVRRRVAESTRAALPASQYS